MSSIVYHNKITHSLPHHDSVSHLYTCLSFYLLPCSLCKSLSEWDCAPISNMEPLTDQRLSISGNNSVEVKGILEIVGIAQSRKRLVTITAASGKRHFYINGHTIS